MVDFNTCLVAQDAMRKSVGEIFADATLTEPDRDRALLKNAQDYAEYVGVSFGQACEFVTKVAGDAGTVPAAFTKIIKKDADPHGLLPRGREKLPDEKVGFPEPDPALVGRDDDSREEEPMKQSTKRAMLMVTRADFASEVAKIRAENPKLSTGQARSIYFSQNPGLYDQMRKWAAPPGDDLAKRQPSSAQLEVATKTAAIQEAHPEFTHAQAYTKAIETTPGLMKRLLRGEA